MSDPIRRSLLMLVTAVAALALLLGATALPAMATDGAGPSPGHSDQPTHYESLLEGQPLPLSIAPSPGFPETLHMVDSSARLEYRASATRPGRTLWEVRVRDFERRHERVDAVFDMILVLPLPEATDGSDGFAVQGGGVELREGTPDHSTPALYEGKEVVLKRNHGLEQALLPGLVGRAGEAGKLPALDGTGYRYTFWDTVVRYDPGHGESVQGWAGLRYATDPRIAAPEPGDPRFSGWWITWIPSLPATVPPYTVRIDVTEPRD